jgi:hypothetical protein
MTAINCMAFIIVIIIPLGKTAYAASQLPVSQQQQHWSALLSWHAIDLNILAQRVKVQASNVEGRIR